MAKTKTILIGAGVVGIGLLTLYSMKRRKEKPNLIIRDELPFGFNAMTIPPIGIFVSRCNLDNEKLLRHELIHWKQYSERGLVGYYLGYALQALQFGYDKMPMEHEARWNEDAYAKSNYTEAVRSGDADTVYDPDFRK